MLMMQTFEPESYIVYVQTDAQNNIIAINSSAFLDDTENWTRIDDGIGDKYHHAQNHYLDKPIYTDDGVPRYKLVDGKAVERTNEEIEADKPELPLPQPTITDLMKENELLKAQIKAQSDRNDFMEDCIAEMAMQVYS